MKENENYIVLSSGKKTVKYKIIMSFETKNNMYYVYTDNKPDEDGCLRAYAGIYTQDEKGKYLQPVEEESDLMLIERLLANLNKDGEKKNEE